MEQRNEVVIITHAGASAGGGHVGRCFALSEGFAAQGVSVSWMVNESAAEILLRRGLARESIAVIENPFVESAACVFEEVAEKGPTFCIVDSYEAESSFMAELRGLCKTLLINDCRTRPVERECDVLLNYNLNASLLRYETGYARLLLGPEFALLRSSFWDLEPLDGESIVIIPGAGDHLNTGRQFMEWWEEDWPPAELVSGPLVESSVAEALFEAARTMKNFSVLYDPQTLPEIMAQERAVLCTSSVTSYEALSLRKPLAVFQTADNQLEIGREIERRGLGVNLGPWGEWGYRKLRQVIENLPPAPAGAVNPCGAKQVAMELLKGIV